MLSPLLDAAAAELLLEDSWELTALHTEAANLATAEFWKDIEEQAAAFPMITPAASPARDLDALLDWSVDFEAGSRDLVHHDCMWAGKCDDRLHPGNHRGEPPPPPSSPIDIKTESEIKTEIKEEPDIARAPPGRSLLLVQQRRPPRPDTPLSLDEDEPPQFRHQVDVATTARRLLHPAPPRDTVAADHSYTAKPIHTHGGRHATAAHSLEHLGVQTPSDSEEEIDVETVGENRYSSLPTNPSLVERASLQRSVASGLGSRKRHAGGGSSKSASKRARRAEPPRRRPRAPDSDSEPDGTDVERRSLHNDMERMRRIGLKNLFDELKAAVPSTRDKARAPKVAILREAASLCRRLQAEDREREALRRQQQRLLARVRRLRQALHSANAR